MELPTLDTNVVDAIKKLRDNIKNDFDQHHSADQIQDMVVEHKLAGKKAYKPLLQSVCNLLREKGYPGTADVLAKDWRL